METVTIDTSDGVRLVGDLVRPQGRPVCGVLLLHMMPATRGSWRLFSRQLAERGALSLAIDLRGHGESIWQGKNRLNWHAFSDREHQASRDDVTAALNHLRGPLAAGSRVGIVGASIGANLALEALANHGDITWAVCLSPGRNYHGLETAGLVARLTAGQRLFLAASDDDPESLRAVRALAHEETAGRVTTRELSGVGHGTTMWERQPRLMDDILAWIEID